MRIILSLVYDIVVMMMKNVHLLIQLCHGHQLGGDGFALGENVITFLISKRMITR